MTTAPNDHRRRYGALFGLEPWWDGHVLAYELLAQDWNDAEVIAMAGLEQQLFALAKARGLDTVQTCPYCKLRVDEPRSLGEHGQCEWCDLADEEDEWQILLENARRSVLWDAWFNALTTGEQAAYRARRAQDAMFMINGLITRNVQ